MNFKKIALLVSILFSVTTVSVKADPAMSPSESVDWEPVMDAIIQVESGGNSMAVKGIYAGCMQIAPVLVKQVNLILQSQGKKKRYSLKDRYSEKKSKEMFLIIQSYYNPANSVEHAIRLWNGGVKYKVRNTNRYYNKVIKVLND